MTFSAHGFSHDVVEKLRAEQRGTYREIFALSDECSRHALKIVELFAHAKTKRELTSNLFFARCVSHYQAAISLAEGGMTIESLVLTRSLLETVFVLLAIAEDAVTPGELAGHDYASRIKHANSLLSSTAYPNVAPFKEKLTEFVDNGAGSRVIDAHEFARRGKAPAVYDGLYRHLSHHAAHPSLSAVNSYLVDRENGGFSASYHPLLEDTPAAVLSACAGVLLACFGCDKAGVRTEETNMEGNRIWAKYEEMYERCKPW